MNQRDLAGIPKEMRIPYTRGAAALAILRFENRALPRGTMRFSMNMLLWTDNLLEERFLPLLARLKKMGYDGIEIPIFRADEARYAALGRKLDDIGLARTVVTMVPEDANPISPDAACRKRAVEHLKAMLDSTWACGAEMMVGPYYAPVNLLVGRGRTEDEWKWGVETLRPVAEYARKLGVELAIEHLNRFEIYFLNCAADTDRFVRDIGIPGTGVLYDTFHANIEEKDVSRAIAACVENLKQVHVSENDRSTPGTGSVRWVETFKALKEGGYDGWLTIEAFGLTAPSLASALRIWRRMFEDEETLAREGLAFAKRMWAA